MAREIVIHRWCDLCLADGGDHVDATFAEAITIGGHRPMVLELCAPHVEELIDPVLAAFAHGRSPGQLTIAERKDTDDNPIQCPLCDAVPSSRSALGKHLNRVHETNLTAVEAGELPLDVPTNTYVCQECGRAFDSPQGRGAHRNRAHGVAGVNAKVAT